MPAGTVVQHVRRFAVGLFFIAIFPAGTLPAQQVETPTPARSANGTEPITVELVKSRQEKVAAATELSAETKEKAAKLYDQALEKLQLVATHTQQLVDWKALRENAPQQVADLKKQLSLPPRDVAIELPPDASLLQLEQLLSNAKVALADAQRAFGEIDAESARRATRRGSVVQLEQEARQRLSDIEKTLAAPPSDSDPAELVLAQQSFQQASRLAAQSELEMLQQELPSYDATIELIKLQRDAAQQAVVQAQKAVERWEQIVAERRAQDETEQKREAQRDIRQAHPLLQPLAEENERLAKLRTVAAKIKEVTDAERRVDGQLEEVQEGESDLEEKLELPGMSDYIAPLLMQLESKLPRVPDLGREVDVRQREISATRFTLIDLQDRITNFDLEQRHKEFTDSLDPSIDGPQRDQLVEDARALLMKQRDALIALDTDYTSYFNRLNDLNAKQQQLIAAVEKSNRFLSRQLLWRRATPAIEVGDIAAAGRAFVWLVDPEQWRNVARDWVAAVSRRPAAFLFSLLLIVVLFATRGPTHRQLKELGQAAGRSYLVPFSTTLKALCLTLLMTLLGPAVMAWVGWTLYWHLGAADFSRGVGAGLLIAARTFLLLELLRLLCIPNGLAEAHFRWRPERISLIRRHLAWLIPIALALEFGFGMTAWDGTPERRDTLGRLFSILALVVVSVFLWFVLRRIKSQADEAAQAKVRPLHRLIHGLAVGSPLALAVLSLVGYRYTSIVLVESWLQTIWLGLGLVIFQGVAHRWLRLVRGKKALEQARARQLERKAAETDSNASKDASAGLIEAEEKLDLEAINLQTRQLLQVCLAAAVLTGFWFIWLDVMPGLGFLEHELWTTTYEVSRTVTEPDGTLITQAVTQVRAITISQLILAVLVGLVATVAARNLPGLVEVSLPESLPLDAGARYALSTLMRYVIVAIGVVVTCALLGVGWSKVQWLIAALSVGVGFGLQELVANFISGLIVLFERPVRVGDIVSVDNVTGVVTRVKIRATTVRNWDRQEYIIPNKDLITGRVINWTLSDSLNRIVIPIGVAYGSDTERARELLLKILDEHPQVLRDPAPLVTFEGFGDSTLNMIVRAILPSMDGRITVIHQLHTAIHQEFAKAGIEIAFPQRDLHVRSLPEPLMKSSGSQPASEHSDGNGTENPTVTPNRDGAV